MKMNGRRRMYRSTKKRVKAIIRIVNEMYEPGNQSRCYKAIWRDRIYPEYGVCYATFLSYIGVRPSDLDEEPDTPADSTRQLRLFDE